MPSNENSPTALYRESFETVAAVVSWMDEQEKQGRDFPPKMKPRLIKAAGVIRDELDDPPDVGINGEGTEVLYGDE